MKSSFVFFVVTAFLPFLGYAEETIKREELKMPDQNAPRVEVPKETAVKSPAIAATLSSLCPGLGHVYLGDYTTSGSLFATTATGMVAAGVEKKAISAALVAGNMWSYSVYAAYRDARILSNHAGCKYQMPLEDLSALTTASFEWAVIKKPEVWGGVLGLLTLASAISYFTSDKKAMISASKSGLPDVSPIAAFPVGIGEEALFRGYCQSSFVESFGEIGGIAVASLVFGAAHIGNIDRMDKRDRLQYLTVGVPFISCIGVYLGWLTNKNHSLKESVAVHSWYDFILFAAKAAVPEAKIGHSSFSLSYNF